MGESQQRAIEAHVAAAVTGRKPLYFDPWGDEFSEAFADEYSKADGLIRAMIEARNPALVILLMDAAAGRGAATTGQARMAAAAALANYHTVPVTEVLYDLSKNESNEQVRKQATRSLKAIQTNE